MAEIIGLAVLSAGLFSLIPYTAHTLVLRSQRRFDAWFEAGARAYCASTQADAWTQEFARGWETHVVRLAQEGALTHDQLSRAGALLNTSLACPTGAPHHNNPVRELGAKTIIFAAVGGLVAQIALALTQSALLTLLCCAITAGALCFTLTDLAARIIPTCLVFALSIAGVLLRLAAGQTQDLAVLCVIGAAVGSIAVGLNAIYRKRYPGTQAIGNGDIKALVALVLCSGVTGLIPGALAMLLSVLIHALFARATHGHTTKLPLGPALAVGFIVGATSSVL